MSYINKENAKELGSQGGKIGGKAGGKRMQTVLNEILSKKVKLKDGKELTVREQLALKLVDSALNSTTDIKDVLNIVKEITDRVDGKSVQMQINQNENSTEYVFVTEKDQKKVDKNLESLLQYAKKD